MILDRSRFELYKTDEAVSISEKEVPFILHEELSNKALRNMAAAFVKC